ncbi:MAG TPA: ergothioneine biosynthesis protein EgtB [Oligoflexus sp.]|uniref:ergothioneine biosynthesis protein EgtB n=1 Tax=Oligoflexus sp. TaxID=1971216 RepID=UPI002D2502C9|nr:ergothioneine biosynthesis protein EgtB [Oligoflexus sp.]HYX38801.1 ergothioneine biosynthesis protein EgtB [Oligoflexus sp.]
MLHDETLQRWLNRYLSVRACTESICAPLSEEDCMIQACEDVSPAKWHLAHTSWFFERFLLRDLDLISAPFHPRFDFIFNSYYKGVGSIQPRPQRGLLARPRLEEVMVYRRHVDEHIINLLNTSSDTIRREQWTRALNILEIGIQHEQQHQELLLTDMKYNAYAQPLQIAPYPTASIPCLESRDLNWIELPTGLHHIGHQAEGFAFDNASPHHIVYIGPVVLASRPTTNGEYMEFMEEGGYQRSELWLSEGWNQIKTHGLECPFYWQKTTDGSWQQFTLHGWQALDPLETLCHLSYYEADAFARARGARLPSEQEWEVWAHSQDWKPRGFDLGNVQPRRAQGIFGAVWEWTMSSYSPYPGYQPWRGTVGEYNGKFMVNQYVLRGGSCATPPDHIRPSYRNFFPPHARWQFSGLRLAKDLL